MGYYYRYRFDPTADATFVEGSQGLIDFGDVALTGLAYWDSADPRIPNPPHPPLTSVTSVTVAIANASASDHLMMDIAALTTDFIVNGGPGFEMTLSRWAFTSSGIPFPDPYAFITGGVNGQPLVIALARAATQNGSSNGTFGNPDPGGRDSPGEALLLLEELLDHILFWTDSIAPGPSKVITFSFGGVYGFGQASVTLPIQESNSQPVLTNGAQALLGAIGEHATNAFQVSSFRQSHSDADGPNSGIAITAATANNGHWEYRIDGTSSWIALDTVSGSSSLLLKDTDWVRFVGDGSLVSGQNAGNTITYRIWDRFAGTVGTKVNTDSPDGHSPYSSSQASAALTISGANDAPVMPDVTATLAAITEDQTQNGGQTVASFRGTINDADPGALKGIAITGEAAGNGQWQYKLNGSSDWVSLVAVDAANALLLRDNDLIRLVPDAANGTSAALTYAAWDQTNGAAGGRADLTAAGATGGATAFSTGTQTASITVTAVNDPPTATNLTRALTTLEETPSAPLGIEVTDVDAGATITATLTLANPALGALSTAGGGSYDAGTGVWTVTGSVSVVNAALAAVTLVPAPNSHGATTITTQIRDAAGTGPSGSIALTITPVNDPPTVAGATQTHSYAEDAASVALDPITIADSDVGDSVTVTLTLAHPAAGVISGAGGTFAGGVWTFTGSVASANQALAALVFTPATDNDVNTTIAVRVRDAAGTGPALDGTITLDVTPAEDIATISVVDVVDAEAKLPSIGLFSIASKVTIVDPDRDDAAHPVKYVAGSGHVSNIDGPPPPDETLADLLTLDADTGQIIYDRSAFRWLAEGDSVVYTITFLAKSGDDPAQEKTITVTINGLNDAPVLATPSHATFAATTEDSPPTAARTVGSFRGSVTDGDPSPLFGIAITATVGHGDWQYSTDGGTTWTAFVASATSALLLRDTDLVRFAPDGKNGGEAGFTYRAWDQTSGGAGGFADTSTNGSGAAFSRQTDVVTLAITAINDAPVMTPDHMTLLGITEDDASLAANPGQSVWQFLCNAIGDVDIGAVQGIALSGTTDGNGHWEYSVDGGATWAFVGTRSESAALLLEADDHMRFVPDEKNGTTATLTYHAWDRTTGTHGTSVDLTAAGATGGTTAYSTLTDTVSITVFDVNDTPQVSAPVVLAPLAEDSGTRLITQAVLLGQTTDADTGAALTAADLELVGAGTLTDNLDGTWTYTPAPNDDTSVSFTYTVTDGLSTPVAATAALDLTPVNDAPQAQIGLASVDEDAVITGTVTASDVDNAAGALTFALVGANGGALHGTVTLDAATGAYVYTPDRDFFGTDSFSFTATDGVATSAAASVSISVNPVNDAPAVTTASPLSVGENQIVVVALGGTDIDGPSPVSFTIAGGADASLFDIVAGNLVFRAARDYEADAHSYQVEIAAFDGIATSTRTLTVNLTDVNDNAPVFASGTGAPAIVPESTAQAVYAAAAIDADGAVGNTVAYSLSGDDAAHFAIDLSSGIVRFATAPDYEAPRDQDHDNVYRFIVHANDGLHDATQAVSVTVTDVNDAPVAAHGVASGEQAIAGQLAASDADSPILTYSLVSGPAHGTLSVKADGTFSYAADLGYRGADSFTFKANDGALDSNVAAFDLNVTQLHLKGGMGSDSFTAVGGNELIEAGGGIDTISFDFKLTDATFTWAGNQVIVDTASSHTVLTGVEVFNFTDGTVNNNDGDALVDDLHYYAGNHDVWNARVDADAHYHSTGWHEWRDPSAFFSTSFYLAVNADVRASGADPLVHFGEAGWAQGRQPSMAFDSSAYLKANPDVAAAHLDPLAHFLAGGAAEGRQPVALTALIAANGFDYVYYLSHNPDVAAAHIDPYLHFQAIGWQEGRNPNALFDVNGYLATYRDVAAAHINPLAHYDQNGWKEGRDPSAGFDTVSYLAANPDVAAASINPLTHFLHVGQQEGRSAFADGVWG